MPVSPFSLRLASFSSLRRLSYLFFISKISRSASSSICFLVSSYSRSCWRDSSCDCGGRSEKLNKEFAVCSNRTLGYRLSMVVKFAFLTDAKATTTCTTPQILRFIHQFHARGKYDTKTGKRGGNKSQNGKYRICPLIYNLL